MKDRNNKKNKITNEEYDRQDLNENFNDNNKSPSRKITLDEDEMRKLLNKIEKEDEDLINKKDPIENIKNSSNHKILTNQAYMGPANYGPARNVKEPRKSLFCPNVNNSNNQNNI
jgi:hypothetical protein